MKNLKSHNNKIEDRHKISAIMPVYNGADFLNKSLPPLVSMWRKGELVEIIFVDDGCTDDSVRVAKSFGIKVISTSGRLGPGAARNQAASRASGDILWFIDADVVVANNAAKLIMDTFESCDIIALFGSYDDSPWRKDFFSQYKNLVHHYYHQNSRLDASTFWAGCGAIRKQQFLELGGFDTRRRSIEDIELGYRLNDKGYSIRLVKELQCTHLKYWRLLDLLRTEIFCRALPWSRLILSRQGFINDLNVRIDERLRAGLAGLFFVGLVSCGFGLVPWVFFATVFFLTIIANRNIVTFFYKRNGWVFAAEALLYHQLYYLYSSMSFIWAVAEHKFNSFQCDENRHF